MHRGSIAFGVLLVVLAVACAPAQGGRAAVCGPTSTRCQASQQLYCSGNGEGWWCISSRTATRRCGPSTVRCREGYAAGCLKSGRWTCVEKKCGANTLLCIIGSTPVCKNGEWVCEPKQCGPLTKLCKVNTTAVCTDGQWTCEPKQCGPLTKLCKVGTAAVCTGGEWVCEATSAPTAEGTATGEPSPSTPKTCDPSICLAATTCLPGSQGTCTEDGECGCEPQPKDTDQCCCYRRPRCSPGLLCPQYIVCVKDCALCDAAADTSASP